MRSQHSNPQALEPSGRYQVLAGDVTPTLECPSGEGAPGPVQDGADAVRARVTGKAVPPFLLDRILHLTAGRSLATNIALIRSNARLAAEIALAIAAPAGRQARQTA